MKALIILRENHTDKLRSFFPFAHPAMVPLCNKPLLEYMVDFICLSKCKSMLVVMEKPGKDVKDYFGNGDRWGIKIAYGKIKPDESIDTVLERNHSFCSHFPFIILDGFFFIHYDKLDFGIQWDKITDTALLTSCNTGSLILAPSEQSLRNISKAGFSFPFALSRLETLDDLFRISMEILDAEQKHYVLPGYKENKNMVSGKNVSMEANVEILPPVIIGNNVRFRDHVIIGPHTVIGHNVIVDKNTCVRKSVVLSNTYIGQELQVEQKIVHGKKIVSSSRNDFLEVEDESLFSFLPSVFSFRDTFLYVKLFVKSIQKRMTRVFSGS